MPLFPDLEWNKPERRDLGGKLAIIGGQKLGFSAAAEAYQTAMTAGAGEVRVLLPDALKKSVPPSMSDVLFAPSTVSGGLEASAAPAILSLADWADVVLLVGDAGKNSQTAAIYEDFAKKIDKPLVLTRDAIDLVANSFSTLLDNPNIAFVASFSQVQKIFKAAYYPKMITFSMQLSAIVEALHKFTVTYPVAVVTFHAEHLIVAKEGRVVTQNWSDPMAIWRGRVAARAASYLLWSPSKQLESICASLASS